MLRIFVMFLGLMISPMVFADASLELIALPGHTIALTCLFIFALSYVFVMAEEFTEMRKSKPVLLAAGAIWILIAILAKQYHVPPESLQKAVEHNLIEYASLLLFLLVAMTYINAMTERRVFEALRCWLVQQQMSYRKLFWLTGGISFFLSPIADNLTTALLMGAVILSLGRDNLKFVTIGFVNVVVAANAGGAFSPFGDITTLMVWQANKVTFFQFFQLFIPSVVNYIIPAFIMSFALSHDKPALTDATIRMKRGAKRLCSLFFITIFCAVGFKQFLGLPPFMGMMLGLSFLFFFSYFLKKTGGKSEEGVEYNIFNVVEQAEWDTLCFFFGVVFCVGGLGTLGYLELASHITYDGWGHTAANISAGLFSAVVDNIPVMFAVLSMEPEMDLFQWLLITLTAGVGGSLLSVGSAAGVALMGQFVSSASRRASSLPIRSSSAAGDSR